MTSPFKLVGRIRLRDEAERHPHHPSFSRLISKGGGFVIGKLLMCYHIGVIKDVFLIFKTSMGDRQHHRETATTS